MSVWARLTLAGALVASAAVNSATARDAQPSGAPTRTAAQPDTLSAEEKQKVFGLFEASDRAIATDPTRAARLEREAAQFIESRYGRFHLVTADFYRRLALFYQYRDRSREAESTWSLYLGIRERLLGANGPGRDFDHWWVGQFYENELRFADAEPHYRKSLELYELHERPPASGVATAELYLGAILNAQGLFTEGKPHLQRSLSIREVVEGSGSRAVGQSLMKLADSLEGEGQYPKAEDLWRRALRIRENDGPGRDLFNVLASLASNLAAQRNFGEAERHARRAYDIARSTNDSQPYFAQVYADIELALGKGERAVALYREACGDVGATARAADADFGDVGGIHRRKSSACHAGLAFALNQLASRGGGRGVDTNPAELYRDSFAAAQAATASAASSAILQTGAGNSLAGAGLDEVARRYDQLLAQRARLSSEVADAMRQKDAGEVARLTAQRAALDESIEGDVATLRLRAPRYWDYRFPDVVPVTALQAMTGPDRALLRPNEALIVWMTRKDTANGLVFVITKNHFAGGVIASSYDQLSTDVSTLRQNIERGARAAAGKRPAFDAALAHRLYKALLGDRNLTEALRAPEIDTFLIVPSGPLTSLPPGLLVLDEPKGPVDARALPKIHWLVRDKAVAILPSVSALRTLRQLRPDSSARGSADRDIPLIAFADPDFRGDGRASNDQLGASAQTGAATPLREETVRSYDIRRVMRRGRADPAALAALDPLPGTLLESTALARLMATPSQHLVTGPKATETELRRRSDGDILRRAKVLAFATHGFVAGEIGNVAEPALALARPRAGADPRLDDGLLTASEAAMLRLNADWVILSACNTASPDAPEADGISGLSRAFFKAGASALLVSHWRVRDHAAERLVVETFQSWLGEGNEISKAQALRSAMLRMIDVPPAQGDGVPAAHPAIWAPFVLVGTP